MLAQQVLAALRAAVVAAPSQSQLARELKLSQGTINDYLNGRCQPDRMTLATFERLLPRLGLRVLPVGRCCSRCAPLDDAGLALALRIQALPDPQRGAILGRVEAYEELNPPLAPARHRRAGA